MDFIWQFIGACFAVAGAVVALTIAMIMLYVVTAAWRDIMIKWSKDIRRKKAKKAKQAKKGTK